METPAWPPWATSAACWSAMSAAIGTAGAGAPTVQLRSLRSGPRYRPVSGKHRRVQASSPSSDQGLVPVHGHQVEIACRPCLAAVGARGRCPAAEPPDQVVVDVAPRGRGRAGRRSTSAGEDRLQLRRRLLRGDRSSPARAARSRARRPAGRSRAQAASAAGQCAGPTPRRSWVRWEVTPMAARSSCSPLSLRPARRGSRRAPRARSRSRLARDGPVLASGSVRRREATDASSLPAGLKTPTPSDVVPISMAKQQLTHCRAA